MKYQKLQKNLSYGICYILLLLSSSLSNDLGKPLQVITSSVIPAVSTSKKNTYNNKVIHSGNDLPSLVDNSKAPYFREIFKQNDGSCGDASGVGIVFTYEINAARKLPADTPENLYPYFYTYQFLNDGGTTESGDPHQGWKIIQENGIPNLKEYGDVTVGFPTRWVSGYDTYYKGMHNRIADYFSFTCSDPQGIQRVKEWLYDRGNGSETGGLLIFKVNSSEYAFDYLPEGTPHAGRTILLQWGWYTPHCLTLVGYDDSVRYDINLDDKFTTTIDINDDGIVDMQDWEIGAFKFANTWGTSFPDKGFTYMLYRNFAIHKEISGHIDNKVHGLRVHKTYTPAVTFKVTLTHNSRNNIKIRTGVSPDVNATRPSIVQDYEHQFSYAGGSFPLGGENMDSTLEIGLDVSNLVDSLPRKESRFFLQIVAKGGKGIINRFSLRDYRGTSVKELICSQKEIPIKPKDTTTLSIVWDDSIAIKKSKTIYSEHSSLVHIAPNPVTNTNTGLHISINDRNISSGKIRIFDNMGNTVHQTTLLRISKNSPGDKAILLFWDLKSKKVLEPGVYCVLITVKYSDGTSRDLKKMLGIIKPH